MIVTIEDLKVLARKEADLSFLIVQVVPHSAEAACLRLQQQRDFEITNRTKFVDFGGINGKTPESECQNVEEKCVAVEIVLPLGSWLPFPISQLRLSLTLSLSRSRSRTRTVSRTMASNALDEFLKVQRT